MNQSNDRIFLAADGGFYFYADDTRTGSYGPYATPDLAAQKLNEYLAWLHQQAAAETVAPQEPESQMAQTVAEYVRLRDMKAEIAERHKQELAVVTDQMDKAESWIMAQMMDLGVESVKVAAGTVYTQTRMLTGIGDKGALMDFIRQTGQPELLQARVSSDAVKQYMADHAGALPPGVKVDHERVVTIRRA